MRSKRRLLATLSVFGIALFVWTQHGFDQRSGWRRSSRPYVRPAPPAGRFNWADRVPQYPVVSMRALPAAASSSIPRIQHSDFASETRADRSTRLARQAAVKETFLHSWRGYKKHAWLHDELTPVDGGSKQSFGWATTLIDSLDTLWIMGETREFEEAVDALRSNIDLTAIEADPRSIFETTIRHFGGLLAAYDVSGARYPALLDMAVEMGDMLYAAFDTPNRMPVNWWHWKHAQDNMDQIASSGTSIAELGSLSLEFTHLTQLTGDPKFYDAVQRVSDALDEAQDSTRLPGMWPLINNAATLQFFIGNTFSLGALSDSAYEYLPKQYLMLGGALDQPRRMYVKAFGAIKKYLLYRPMLPEAPDILFSGNAESDYETKQVQLDPEAQHLACFVGGMVELASRIFDRPDDADVGRRLVDGCIWAYSITATGIMPESMRLIACEHAEHCAWNQTTWDAKKEEHHGPPGVRVWGDRRYILRYVRPGRRAPSTDLAGPRRSSRSSSTTASAATAATSTRPGLCSRPLRRRRAPRLRLRRSTT